MKLKTIIIPLLFLLATALTCGADSSSDSATDQDTLSSRMIEWLRENGAYINPKLSVRSARPSVDGGVPYRGVFANEEIGEGEVVCRIPWELIMKPSEQFKSDAADEVTDCGTMQAVFEAMNQSEDDTTPYIKYLLAQSKTYTPGFWSDPAKNLLLGMLESNRQIHLTEYDELPREYEHV